MPLDLLIPFAILFILVVYLIYTRQKFEKNVVDIYEKKFEEWKDNSDTSNKQSLETKELIGLVYKKGYKVHIEFLDEQYYDKINKEKIEIKKG